MSNKNQYFDEETLSLVWDECSYDDMEELVRIGMLRMCGCNTNGAFEKLIATLRLCDRRAPNDKEWVGFEAMCETVGVSDDVMHILLQYLDNIDLIQHGTSIRSAWLTSKGEECLEAYSMIEQP